MTSSIHSHIYKFLDRSGPLADSDFTPSPQITEFLHTCKILVIGAGGLGCELLKGLALMGFNDLFVIDMDTIDVSNLNRQFLFRECNVGQSKAQTAAEFIMKRIPSVRVTAYYGKIQDKDVEFYSQFTLVICGLDSVEARRWMNATLVGMVDVDDPSRLKPMIDGGTEGFKGQSRVIIPTVTSCYECSLDMLGKQITFPLCTIANTPRLPEHCIEYASVIEWPNVWKDVKLDTDNPQHIQWIYSRAMTRAAQFNIKGVTYSLTLGVVKNIIPAIASTNAIVAASCVHEAFKIVTTCASMLNNYMMYVGTHGVYTFTFQHEKKQECAVCGMNDSRIAFNKNAKLSEFLEYISNEYRLKLPSIRTATRSIFMQNPPQLYKVTKGNLEKTLAELELDNVIITDVSLPISLSIRIE